jgi:hypothetical protein
LVLLLVDRHPALQTATRERHAVDGKAAAVTLLSKGKLEYLDPILAGTL